MKTLPLEVSSLVRGETVRSVLSDAGDKFRPCAWEEHAENNQLSINIFSIIVSTY